jgi:hypothetical protein
VLRLGAARGCALGGQPLLGQAFAARAPASRRLAPGRLLETGYEFWYPEIDGALRHELAGAHAATRGGKPPRYA